MSYQTFLSEIKKGMQASVYVFHTTDAFLVREAVDSIKRLVPEEERDFNLHVYDLTSPEDEKPPLEQILNVANTVSFFGTRRFTLLIANLHKLSKKDIERIEAFISNPAPDAVFVIFHYGILKREMRERFRIVKTASLDIKEAEVPYWIKQKAKMKGFEISDEVTDYLLGIIGADLGLLSSEIEKISLLGKKKIYIDDISEIVAGGRVYDIFDLVEALKARNAEKTFMIYKTLREIADDYGIIGALNWQYGRTLRMKSSVKENEYYTKVFEILNQADIDIKSSGRNFPMEFLLIKLLRLQEESLPSW